MRGSMVRSYFWLGVTRHGQPHETLPRFVMCALDYSFGMARFKINQSEINN